MDDLRSCSHHELSDRLLERGQRRGIDFFAAGEYFAAVRVQRHQLRVSVGDGEGWREQVRTTGRNNLYRCLTKLVSDLPLERMVNMVTDESTTEVFLSLYVIFLEHRLNSGLAGAVLDRRFAQLLRQLL